MARGKAVVSFDVGCARDVLGSIAEESVLDREDVAGMTATIQDWDRDREKLQRLREQFQKDARERFSVAAWQRRVTEALLAALD